MLDAASKRHGAVVTGVSRRAGIGFAIAQPLIADRPNVVDPLMSAHDAESYPSAGPSEMSAVIEQLGASDLG